MLWLCLVAALAIGATTLVVASPALAACNEECQAQKRFEKELKVYEKERAAADAKEEKLNPWEKFWAQCPIFPAPSGEDGCIYGEAGPESYFQAGKATVHFQKPVVLQGGMISEFENENGEFFKELVPALDGKTIVPEAEPGPSLNEGVDAELLPPAEKARYEAYLAAGKSTKTTETVELAAPPHEILVSALNEQEEKGAAFMFPIMVHISNPFLGAHCYDGSTNAPIVIPFTDGETSPEPPNTPIHGKSGKLTTYGEGSTVEAKDAVLVNNSYAAPGVHGCGVEGQADAAINAGLGLPSPAGSNTTVLVGNFSLANSEIIEEVFSEPVPRRHYYPPFRPPTEP